LEKKEWSEEPKTNRKKKPKKPKIKMEDNGESLHDPYFQRAEPKRTFDFDAL
jgi:hypothetical protein